MFPDPQSPWQRRANEKSNGLLRQHLPRGTHLPRRSTDELEAVARTKHRPRKKLTRTDPRSGQRDTTLAPTSRCCIHPLNPVNARPGCSDTGFVPPTSSDPWDASLQASTTPQSNRSGPTCNGTGWTGTRGDHALRWRQPYRDGSKAFAALAAATPTWECRRCTSSSPRAPPPTRRHDRPTVTVREAGSGSLAAS